MSTTTRPAWKHGDIFPIIARIIEGEYERHRRFVVAHEIAALLLLESDARAIIDAAQAEQHEWSLEQIASNMVAWFSQRFTVGQSPYIQAFERTRIDNLWAYRPMSTTPRTNDPEKEQWREAARALGRLGGRRNTPAQAAARLANTKNAGRPRRVCADCGEPVFGRHKNRALDATCHGAGWRWQKPSEYKKLPKKKAL